VKLYSTPPEWREVQKPIMSTYQCPKGHLSSEPDYCSECGAKIQAIAKPAFALNVATATASKPTLSTITCPDCGAPHEQGSGNFCEICGYNFTSGAHGEVPIISPSTVNQIDSSTSNTSTPTSRQTAPSLEIIVTIDPTLRSEESPPPPTDQPPIILKLDKQSNLIGRRSEARQIHPEIALNFDDAISHRHALIIQQPDGTFSLRDIGSSNGTFLNGRELKPMVDIPIKDGDEFTLGHWTKIKVRFQI
jgi:FHA domain